MIYIAHRGNINGPIPEKENHPDYIMNAVKQGFDVEIDVRYLNNKFYLGHDIPQYEVEESFLKNQLFWHHAKNIEALFQLNEMQPNFMVNCFYHNIDDCVLTSGGYIWTYPGILSLCGQSIAVLPEIIKENYDISHAGGICSDYIEEYQKDLSFKLTT